METITKQEKTKAKEVSRLYWAKVAIVGPTGTGKSYLTKTASRTNCGYINTENKPLPYKTTPFTHEGRPKTWNAFMKNLKDYAENPEIQYIVIDSQTMAFQMLNREMKRNFSGWDVAKNYNTGVDEYLQLIKSIEKDVIVFSHDETIKIGDGEKQRRMVVHNKEFEGKIEEHYTIVLYSGSRLSDGKPEYFLHTFEEGSSTKCPEGMFPDTKGITKIEIPNDAKYIFDSIAEYYSI